MHKMASGEDPLPARLSNIEKEAFDPLSGSIHLATNHIYSHVGCGWVDMISEFSEPYGWLGNPNALLLVFTLSYEWSGLSLVLVAYMLDYACFVKQNSQMVAMFMVPVRHKTMHSGAKNANTKHPKIGRLPYHNPHRLGAQVPHGYKLSIDHVTKTTNYDPPGFELTPRGLRAACMGTTLRRSRDLPYLALPHLSHQSNTSFTEYEKLSSCTSHLDAGDARLIAGRTHRHHSEGKATARDRHLPAEHLVRPSLTWRVSSSSFAPLEKHTTLVPPQQPSLHRQTTAVAPTP